jgi:hypothetical protein
VKHRALASYLAEGLFRWILEYGRTIGPAECNGGNVMSEINTFEAESIPRQRAWRLLSLFMVSCALWFGLSFHCSMNHMFVSSNS